MKNNKYISSVIKDYRETVYSLNQADLAAKFGITQGTTSKWESGEGSIDKFYWNKLLDLIGNDLLQAKERGDDESNRYCRRIYKKNCSTPQAGRLKRLKFRRKTPAGGGVPGP